MIHFTFSRHFLIVSQSLSVFVHVEACLLFVEASDVNQNNAGS